MSRSSVFERDFCGPEEHAWSVNSSPPEQRVYLSYANNDALFATEMRGVLQQVGVAVSLADEGGLASVAPDTLREELKRATITIVLIGPTTRLSRWVDREIELSTRPTKGSPGAGLIGVVLPTHDDFPKPYYEPESVPLRLHDRIQAEYAVLKKWSTDPAEVARWLVEAERRRRQYDPTPSVRALLELRSFAFSDDADPRAGLASEQGALK